MESDPNQKFYADMMLVSKNGVQAVISHQRQTYQYTVLSELWGLQGFHLSVGGRRRALSDGERVFPVTDAVAVLSRYCLRKYTTHTQTLERMVEGKTIQIDRELARLFVVKVWALYCHSYKNCQNKDVVKGVMDRIDREIRAVFSTWAVKLMEVNENPPADWENDQDFRFMRSAYPMFKSVV